MLMEVQTVAGIISLALDGLREWALQGVLKKKIKKSKKIPNKLMYLNNNIMQEWWNIDNAL